MGNSPVYLGFWIDQSRGQVLGSTITTTSRGGNFLIAFLALFVSVVGTSVWKLLRFALHQARATETPKDGFHHQQQAILANCHTALGALRRLLFTAWQWRHTLKNIYSRSSGLIAVAVIEALLLTTAGVFSSRVVRSDNAVLASGQNCSIWNLSAESTSSYSSDLSTQASSAWLREGLMTAMLYARTCYTSGLTGNSANALCGYYANPVLNWTASYVQCPFGDNLCNTPKGNALHLESIIDVASDLGLNVHQKDKLTYHKSMTCAPLRPKHSKCRNETHTWGTDCETVYDYTENGSKNRVKIPYASSALPEVTVSYGVPYLLGYQFWYQSNEDHTTFVPEPSLYTANADVILPILSNTAVYDRPVDDPFFSAHQKGQLFSNVGYLPDEPLSFMGCVAEYHVCVNDQTCSPTTGYFMVNKSIEAFPVNELQRSMLSLAWANDCDIGELVYFLRADILRASDSATHSMSLPLPDDQWTIELSYWWTIMLANLQFTVTVQATGPANPIYQQYMIPPTVEQGSLLCASQVIRRSDYYSFSVLGMALILAIGGVIIVLDLAIPTLLWASSHSAPTSKRLEWTHNSFLQLQRLAFERGGTGSWTGKNDMVPTTTSNELFGPVYIEALDRKDLTTYSSGKVPVLTFSTQFTAPFLPEADQDPGPAGADGQHRFSRFAGLRKHDYDKVAAESG